MRRLAVLLLLAGCAGSAPVDYTVELSTLNVVGAPIWKYEDGEVLAGPSRQTSFLVSPVTYGDFHLSVEFRVDDDTNSGVFIRCAPIAAVDDANPNACYEINIWDNHPNPDFRTGSIVTLQTALADVTTLRRWNRYDIVARGARIDVTLNGVTVASLDDSRSLAGRVALQYAGNGRMRFRNLEIVPL